MTSKRLKEVGGQRFGKLTALYPYCVYGGSQRKIGWVCLCECGTTCNIVSQNLRQGTTTSCGCYHKSICGENSRRLPKGISGSNMLFSSYRARAKEKSQDFSLSVERFREITSTGCHYCGKQPSQIIKPSPKTSRYTEDGSIHGQYVFNGIDRVDNSRGYVEGNVVPCCKICNRAKLDSSYEEFISWIRGVTEWNHINILSA